MAAFNAEKKVERLEFTFGPHYKVKGKELKGIVPEPSDEQMAEYHRRTAEIAKKYRADQDGIDVNDRKAVMEWMASRDPKETVKLEQETAQVHADLCSNKPSYEQLMAIPPRPRAYFYTWLAGELHPEGVTPATPA